MSFWSDTLDKLRLIYNAIYTIETNQERIYDLAEHSDSGATTMNGTEQTVYEQASIDDRPFRFLGGYIDLSTMASGDTIVATVYAKNKSGGTYRQLSSTSYSDAQTDTMIQLAEQVNVYGLKVTLEQTVGTNRDIECEFITASAGR